MKNTIVIALILALGVGFMYISKPSQNDIDICVEATGWSADRCAVELMR